MVNILRSTDTLNRVRTLVTSVEKDTPLLDPTDQRPAVAYTNSGDIMKTVTTSDIPIGGGVTTLTYPNGGVGLIGKETVLAYDGTWDLDVVSSGTTPAPITTAPGVKVYIIAATGVLTLASSGNVFYGTVDNVPDYYKRVGKLPVLIGANNG